ncbi:MAG TPA: MFS transporter [Acetobacteraceae bacterium]|nr:MFS transporter [Acetobacteraceae bacterium]
MLEAGGRAAHRPAATLFVLATVLLDMLAVAIVIPVLPRLVLDLLHGDTVRAAGVIGVFGTAWALMQFVFSPVQGALSDRFGRRPVILLSNLGLGLDYLLMALAPGIGLLLLGRVISGITAASISTAGAYVADISPPERRAAGFGLISVAIGVGFVAGPALGGVLGALDPRLPFWVASGLSLLNAGYGFLVLPESLPLSRRAPFSWRRANPVGALGLLRSRPALLGLSAVNFLALLAQGSLTAVFVLYGTYRYGWDQRTVGLTLAAIGVCSAAVGGLLVQRVVHSLGERLALLLGLAAGSAGFLFFGLARTQWGFWAGVPLLGVWGLASPAAQALMSRQVPGTEQGRLQGASSSLMGLAGLFAPSLFTALFAHGIAAASWRMPGAPFLVAALLLAGAALLAVRVAPGAQPAAVARTLRPGAPPLDPAKG